MTYEADALANKTVELQPNDLLIYDVYLLLHHPLGYVSLSTYNKLRKIVLNSKKLNIDPHELVRLSTRHCI